MPGTAERLEFHPAAGIFPMMSSEEYEGLKADIEAHGLIEPVLLCEGQILDGLMALRKLGHLSREGERLTNGTDNLALMF